MDINKRQEKAVLVTEEVGFVNVGKAWHYLLIHPEKGYYTGYKGEEAFGELEYAKVYRTEQEAYMARLKAGMEVRVESCLLWHSSKQQTMDASRRPAVQSNQVGRDARRERLNFRLIKGALENMPSAVNKTKRKLSQSNLTPLKLVKSS